MSAPPQPSQQTGLDQAQNPAEQTKEEQTKSQQPVKGETVSKRDETSVPSSHQGEATSSSLGYGDTGPLKEKDIGASDAAHGWSKMGNLEGEQMRAPGEGEVAEAVRKGGGGGHSGMEEITAGMDRKAQEHEDILHARGERTGKEIEAEESEDWTGKKADVGEALGGRDTKVVLAAEE